MQNRGSLSGLKVIDLSRMLPGPYCSMILADHGAEVIAIEGRKFQTDSLFFDSLNRNKRHVSLNLKSEKGREIFLRLARDADVIIEGFRPGVVARLGLDYPTIQAENPGIIYCSISGYGQSGPYRDRAGHDVNYLSTAGILGLIGPEQGPPTIPGVQFADIAGGSMNALAGILMALLAREKSGRGQYIDISMTDGIIGYLSLADYFSQKNKENPRRSAELLSHRYGCYNSYETADGRYVVIGAVEHRFWRELCGILNLPECVDGQYDEGQRQVIIDRLREIFKSKTAEQWDTLLLHRDVCYSRVLDPDEVKQQPLFRERGMVLDSCGQDGEPEKIYGIPIKLSDTPGAIRRPPEPFGGSTEEVLRAIGYSTEEVETFVREGVV